MSEAESMLSPTTSNTDRVARILVCAVFVTVTADDDGEAPEDRTEACALGCVRRVLWE